MVFLRRKSRTATLPRLTVVRVPSQRSAMVQTVPRTVAEELRPRVRYRPVALERRRRIVRRESPAAVAEPERSLPRARQPLKLPPLSRSSVSPRARRARDWSTWKTPALKLPDWVRPRAFRAEVIRDVPKRASTNEPIGTCRTSSSGTNTRPLTGGSYPGGTCELLARAAAAWAGTLTKMSPETSSRLKLPPSTGGPGSWPISVNSFCAAVVSIPRAGLGSTFPDGSIARTTKVCAPGVSVGVVNGDEQAANAPWSMLHSNVEPCSSEENSNMGVESVVGPAGPVTMDVSGGRVSIVKARVAGLASRLPATSMARASKAWGPSPSGSAGVCGDVQAANDAASNRHWKLAPASSEPKLNVGVESLVAPDGPSPIVVSGTPVSTLKLRAAAGPLLRALSRARTSNVCAPSASAAVVCGDVQVANGCGVTRHWNVAVESEDVKLKVGVVSFVRPSGPAVMLGAGGAVESSTYGNAAEQVEVLPAVSVAVARKLVGAREATGTGTGRPGLAKSAAGPVATTVPVQFAVV